MVFNFEGGISSRHLTTNDIFPPPGGYKPNTGTIFDLFNKHGVTWADYFLDARKRQLFFRTIRTSCR